jgi:hypothetical protein
MTDRAQFEAMLEALINEDQDAAKEIFHNIVVGKSREIYEELLAEDFSPEEANRAAGGHTQSESMEEEGAEEDVEEDMEEEGADEEGDDDSEDNPFGGEDDGEDEPEDDGEDDEFGGEDDAEGGDMEDRVMDLEDALEDLKAEFEQLLSQEGEEGGHDMDAIHDAGMGGDDDMEMGMDDEGSHMPVMEYYKKVSVSHGDNGQNTKSTIDNMKNDMGGSNKNIAQNFSTTTGGTTGGLAKNTPGDLTKGMNVHNRVQSNAGKTAFKKTEPGHGAEKKGKGETNVDKKSLIGGKIR